MSRTYGSTASSVASTTIERSLSAISSCGHPSPNSKPEDDNTGIVLEKIFKVGDRVKVSGYGNGVIKFIGETQFSSEIYAGVELDEPVGDNDGSYDEERYFFARDKTGVFVRTSKLRLITGDCLSIGPSDLLSIDPNLEDIQTREDRTFSVTINDGLITIDTSLNISQLQHKSSQLGPAVRASVGKLEDQFASTNATDNKNFRLELLFQFLENEFAKLNAHHLRQGSHFRRKSTKHRRGRHSRIKKSFDKLGISPGPKSNSLSPRSIGFIKTQALQAQLSEKLTAQAPSEHVSPNTFLLPVVETPSMPKISIEINKEEDSGSERDNIKRHRHRPKSSIDLDSVDELESDDYSITSCEDMRARMYMLIDEVEHEREIVKRRDARLLELEDELRQYDHELREKERDSLSLTEINEKLKEKCKTLKNSLETAESEAQLWRWELLYSDGKADMMSDHGIIRSSHLITHGQQALAASRSSEEAKRPGDIDGLNVQEVGADLMISPRDQLKRKQKMEEKLQDYERKLKDQARTIERLEKRCEVLTSSMEEAHLKAREWEFQVLYGRNFNEADTPSAPVKFPCKATKDTIAKQNNEESKELLLQQRNDFRVVKRQGSTHYL